MTNTPASRPHGDAAYDAHTSVSLSAGLHRKHTNPVLVFGILTVATIIEIAVTLLNLPREFIIPVLIAISFVKASLVAAYYMHLRYEKWIYTAIFITPALFAVFLIFTIAT